MKLLLSFMITVIMASGFSQIPAGYYDNAEGLSGEQLKTALHHIIKNHTEYSYSQTDEMMMETDEDPNNSNNVILLYKGTSQAKSTFGGGANDWNREHVWAKSHGDFGETPPCGTDLHHLRPEDASVNSDRGNKDFDNGGVQHSEATGCYYDSDSWEPRDEVKGDVARMIFYMGVRYEGDNGEPDLEVVDWVNSAPDPEHGKYSALYQWHQDDPPDAFEINRNEVIYDYQHNRNPFIDHPEYLILIYDPANAINDTYYNSLSIFPNPAKDQITIKAPSINSSSCVVSICDFQGQEVYNRPFGSINEPENFNVAGLSEGIYFLFIKSENRVLTSKFQVIR